jgi:hypothetical protein
MTTMGSKNNPGKFDCYEKAHPDEPMFVLLGRDPAGAAVVRFWMDLRAEFSNRDKDKAMLDEAAACAEAMDKWCGSIGRKPLRYPRLEVFKHNARLTAELAETKRLCQFVDGNYSALKQDLGRCMEALATAQRELDEARALVREALNGSDARLIKGWELRARAALLTPQSPPGEVDEEVCACCRDEGDVCLKFRKPAPAPAGEKE